jgi:hypothetical protein
MAKKTTDPNLKALIEIRTLLEDLLIIEDARAGISKGEIRKIAGVANSRVTRIWKNLDKPAAK